MKKPLDNAENSCIIHGVGDGEYGEIRDIRPKGWPVRPLCSSTNPQSGYCLVEALAVVCGLGLFYLRRKFRWQRTQK